MEKRLKLLFTMSVFLIVQFEQTMAQPNFSYEKAITKFIDGFNNNDRDAVASTLTKRYSESNKDLLISYFESGYKINFNRVRDIVTQPLVINEDENDRLFLKFEYEYKRKKWILKDLFFGDNPERTKIDGFKESAYRANFMTILQGNEIFDFEYFNVSRSNEISFKFLQSNKFNIIKDAEAVIDKLQFMEDEKLMNEATISLKYFEDKYGWLIDEIKFDREKNEMLIPEIEAIHNQTDSILNRKLQYTQDSLLLYIDQSGYLNSQVDSLALVNEQVQHRMLEKVDSLTFFKKTLNQTKGEIKMNQARTFFFRLRLDTIINNSGKFQDSLKFKLLFDDQTRILGEDSNFSLKVVYITDNEKDIFKSNSYNLKKIGDSEFIAVMNITDMIFTKKRVKKGLYMLILEYENDLNTLGLMKFKKRNPSFILN